MRNKNLNARILGKENPLLKSIPIYSDIELVAALAFNPFKGIDRSSLSDQERLDLLSGPRIPFMPTSQEVAIAKKAIAQVRGSYAYRNPCDALGKQLSYDEREDAVALATGISLQVIKGVTGLGKSTLAQAIVSLLGPQVVIHADVASAGWKLQRQLVYLLIDVGHSASRGGFVAAVLSGLDVALGENFSIEVPKKHRTVDRQIVEVKRLLKQFYIGLIVIDEGRPIEGGSTSQVETDEGRGFLRSLINAGFPILLLGNPNAFDWLLQWGQDDRRVNERAPEHLHPQGSVPGVTDEWETISHGLFWLYLMPRPMPDPSGCAKALRKCSAGFPGYGVMFLVSAQIKCLLAGLKFITPADIEEAFNNDNLESTRRIIEAFNEQSPSKLLGLPDFDVDFYARKWGKEDQIKGLASAYPERRKRNTAVRHVSDATKMKQKQTRDANKVKKAMEELRGLSENDLRGKALKEQIIAAYHALQPDPPSTD